MEPITTAGLAFEGLAQANPRRELLKGVRAVLRRPDATEEEDVDALEALLEMTKE